MTAYTNGTRDEWIAARPRRLKAGRGWGFFGVVGVLFAAFSVWTLFLCRPMPGMEGMTMDPMWMPGEDWPRVAGSFVGMWTVMMVAMMLPSVAPSLRRRYQEAGAGSVMVMSAGYFLVWGLLGPAVYALGAELMAIEMRNPDLGAYVPSAAALAIALAGVAQLSPWKIKHLLCCRTEASSGGAWRSGLKLGVLCCLCCGSLTAVLLVLGVMDLRAMVLVTAAITAERLIPRGERVARVTGALMLVGGLFLLVRALGLV